LDSIIYDAKGINIRKVLEDFLLDFLEDLFVLLTSYVETDSFLGL